MVVLCAHSNGVTFRYCGEWGARWGQIFMTEPTMDEIRDAVVSMLVETVGCYEHDEATNDSVFVLQPIKKGEKQLFDIAVRMGWLKDLT